MEIARYPARTLIGVSLVAALSLYAALDLYGEQIERNKALKDSYQMGEQEKRFEAVKHELPPGEMVGYVSDLGFTPGIFLPAQYALVPSPFVDNPPHGWVIGNFSKPLNYAEYGKAHGLTFIKEFDGGVILFRKTQR